MFKGRKDGDDLGNLFAPGIFLGEPLRKEIPIEAGEAVPRWISLKWTIISDTTVKKSASFRWKNGPSQ